VRHIIRVIFIDSILLHLTFIFLSSIKVIIKKMIHQRRNFNIRKKCKEISKANISQFSFTISMKPDRGHQIFANQDLCCETLLFKISLKCNSFQHNTQQRSILQNKMNYINFKIVMNGRTSK
jgi:hypothetical protein